MPITTLLHYRRLILGLFYTAFATVRAVFSNVMKLKGNVVFLCFLFSIPRLASATDYYVDGALTSDCISKTYSVANRDCSGSDGIAYNSILKVNPILDAGSTVYIREGTYIDQNINPLKSGNAIDNRIIYQSYNKENVVITGNPPGFFGILISNRDYIKVDGVHIKNTSRWMAIQNWADYNEIVNCEFSSDGPLLNRPTILISGRCGGGVFTCNSTHNWFHHNTVYRSGAAACGEGAGLMGIGSASTGDTNSNFNTVENNIFYHGGHHLLQSNCKYTVIRNNIFHNEGFKSNVSRIIGTATGGSLTSLVDSNTNFVMAGVQVGYYVHNIDKFARAQSIASITTTIHSNDTINFSNMVEGFDIGDRYDISECKYLTDATGEFPGDGKYGHRCIVLVDNDKAGGSFNLVENNRIGYASVNPNNNGADGITLADSKNIIRRNYIFGSDGPGIHLKWGDYTLNNKIYNNTLFNNGRFSGTQIRPAPIVRVSIYADNDDSTGNVFKNNILKGATDGDWHDSVSFANQQVYDGNMCDALDPLRGCNNTGNPRFSNTDMSDMTSAINPNLSLLSGSDAINTGVHLTQVSTLDSGTGMNLVVDDASYFQDGSWGSGLSTILSDWVAIGNPTNIVKIASIDYKENVIRLANSISRNDTDSIWHYKDSNGNVVFFGSEPDIGAYEYSGGRPKPPANLIRK